jgi:hypothetical protein
MSISQTILNNAYFAQRRYQSCGKLNGFIIFGLEPYCAMALSNPLICFRVSKVNKIL